MNTSEAAAKVQLLNEEFAGWISEQITSHPQDLWVRACEDYISHARTILREARPAEPPPPRPNGLIFNAAPPLIDNRFFAVAPPTADGQAELAAEAEEEDEEPPAQVEIQDHSQILFRQQAKLYTKDNNAWKDRGKGMLTLRKPEEAGRSPYLVFTTDSGKILLTAALYKGLMLKEGPKNNVTMMLQYVDPAPAEAEGGAEGGGGGGGGSEGGDAGPPGMRLVLFNLLQAEQKAEFLAVVTANKPT